MKRLTRLALSLLAVCPLCVAAAADSIPSKADIGPVPQGRLPDLVKPLDYRIDLTVLPEKERFSGHVEIDVELRSPAKALWIDGRDLQILHAAARTPAGDVIATYEQVDPLGVARLDFQREMPAGKTTLIFDYDAPFSNSDAALFHVQVGNDWYVWSQFESTDARGAFPSFDQPGYKTPFEVTLTTKAGQVTTSNAPEARVEQAGTLERHVFASTRPLPTYLVQFGVGPFSVASGAVPSTAQRASPLPLRVVATQANSRRLEYAFKETPRIVELLERYFGQPFPFPKLDQIGTPIMQGAMENAGADTYGDDILLLDPGAPVTQRQEFGMVVAHELAHQWFGDLVTPDWWSDIWLNESFANWMGYRIGNEWRPELNIGVGAIDEGLAAMAIDSLTAGRPIHQTIADTGEIDSAFDSVTYGKGGQVIAMIAAYLGDEKFRDGVRLHLSRHMYGNATSEDFFAALAEAGHDPRILAAMKSFVDQQGLPVVKISHSADGALVADQKRSALLGSSPPATTWTIPLCMRVGETRSCTLLDKTSTVLDAKAGAPIMPNAGGVGYYRFVLDDADWQALITAAPGLPPGEALAATDSLWGEFWAGEMAPARLIEAARAMAANPDSNASVDGGVRLTELRRRGMIPAEGRGGYRQTIQSIYGPKLALLGSELRAGSYAADAPDRQKQRAALIDLLAEEARDPALRQTLLQATRHYLAGEASALDQSNLGAALLVYVESEGLPGSKRLLAKVSPSQDERFRGRGLYALGNAGSPEEARWLFATFDKLALRPTEKINLLYGLMREPATRDIAYGYFKAHFGQLAKDAGIFNSGRLLEMTKYYCSAEQAQELEGTLGGFERQYHHGSLEAARTVERVRSCGLLKQSRGTELIRSLQGM